MEGGGEEGGGEEGGGEEDDMNELMANRDFIRSVLSSLPGVNPEEALQNLEEMTEQQEKGEDDVSTLGRVHVVGVACDGLVANLAFSFLGRVAANKA